MIGYDLNEQLADREDLDQLKNMGINLKLDFILNHASAQSPQFRDLVEKKISTVNMLGCHDGIASGFKGTASKRGDPVVN